MALKLKLNSVVLGSNPEQVDMRWDSTAPQMTKEIQKKFFFKFFFQIDHLDWTSWGFSSRGVGSCSRPSDTFQTMPTTISGDDFQNFPDIWIESECRKAAAFVSTRTKVEELKRSSTLKQWWTEFAFLEGQRLFKQNFKDPFFNKVFVLDFTNWTKKIIQVHQTCFQESWFGWIDQCQNSNKLHTGSLHIATMAEQCQKVWQDCWSSQRWKIKVGSEWMSTELGSLCYQPPNKEVIKMQLCCLGEISPSSIFFSRVMTNMIRLSKSCKSCCFFFPAADLKLPASKMGCKKTATGISWGSSGQLGPPAFRVDLKRRLFSQIMHMS